MSTWVRTIVSDPNRLQANLEDYRKQQEKAAQGKLDRLKIIADSHPVGSKKKAPRPQDTPGGVVSMPV